MKDVRARVRYLTALLALLAACSSDAKKEVAPNDNGPDEKKDTTLESPWRPTSSRIEVVSSGYWTGTFGYTKARSDLTTEQLDALSQLRTSAKLDVPGEMGYSLVIVDQDGSAVTYGGNGATHFVVYDTLDLFLKTLHCTSSFGASNTTRTTDVPSPPSSEAIATAPVLPSDFGCHNGVSFPRECSDTFFNVDIPASGTYVISSGRCVEHLSLRAYSADGTTLIAESTPGTGDTCFTLNHAFDAGRYVLVMSKTNAAGCSQLANGANETTFQVERAP